MLLANHTELPKQLEGITVAPPVAAFALNNHA